MGSCLPDQRPAGGRRRRRRAADRASVIGSRCRPCAPPPVDPGDPGGCRLGPAPVDPPQPARPGRRRAPDDGARRCEAVGLRHRADPALDGHERRRSVRGSPRPSATGSRAAAVSAGPGRVLRLDRPARRSRACRPRCRTAEPTRPPPRDAHGASAGLDAIDAASRALAAGADVELPPPTAPRPESSRARLTGRSTPGALGA